ncbi:hypothetical protein [Veillonella agrestimuris]|uniref:hypothetical protein n=1 Tax=Veillonella agrestimuris TaxID=2941340 RepID=UPI002041F94C|nr:hypothetical protein [Veillonella agrestimuris]
MEVVWIAKAYPHATLKVLHGTGHFFLEEEKKDEAEAHMIQYLMNIGILRPNIS